MIRRIKAIAVNKLSPENDVLSSALFNIGYKCSKGFKNPATLFCQKKKAKDSQYIVVIPNNEIINVLKLKIRIILKPIKNKGKYINT
ncbi:hypothetical protein [Dysgonomonas sp. GY617]|uniref:hypothetical protein n=1 Tax=Dysgonomonas sp. GY617 TaxID=2780420 RepID=UPI001883617B|nr:hypothetical protein [Dysgonomonas sp. GY617]MBF0576204.1 hypothetical protein [Dysgonomonas sp. GY617]